MAANPGYFRIAGYSLAIDGKQPFVIGLHGDARLN